MNKLFCLLAIIAATTASAATGDITVLSCSDNQENQNPITHSIQVIQDASGAYHYTASECTFVSHGCAGNGGNSCETSTGDVSKNTTDGLTFTNQGIIINVRNFCGGPRVIFDDPTKGLQFAVGLFDCQTQ